MNNDYSIEVNNIKKNFRIYYDKGHTLKETSLFSKRRKYELRPVLKGISFKVKKGEAVGLVGHNGCGKSTTLKMLSRIMYPDEGTIVMNGRVSSLIELGAGFHPDMTGRENIFINASIFGLTHREIEERVAQIIEFSELEEFIDNPVRTYSSGMYMRLAFAVAINVDAEILLIDEILAVGDAAFQSKCFNKLREIKANGTTIVIVSHDGGAMKKFCDRCIWINDGLIAGEGDSMEVIDDYTAYINEKSLERSKQKRREAKKNKSDDQKIHEINQDENKVDESTNEQTEDTSLKEQSVTQTQELEQKQEATEPENVNEDASKDEVSKKEAPKYDVKKDLDKYKDPKLNFGNKKVIIDSVELLDCNGDETDILRSNEKFSLKYHYSVNEMVDEIIVGMGIFTLEGIWIFGTNSLVTNNRIKCNENGGTVIFECEPLNLYEGIYRLQVSVIELSGEPMDYHQDYMHFSVSNPWIESGLIHYDTKWTIL